MSANSVNNIKLLPPGNYIGKLIHEEPCTSKYSGRPYVMQTYLLDNGRTIKRGWYPSTQLRSDFFESVVLKIDIVDFPFTDSLRRMNHILKIVPNPLWFWS